MDHAEALADTLVQKIRHIVITSFGRTSEEATTEQLYYAISLALREEIMINWTAANQTFEHKKVRMAFFLSLEYLPGRWLNNNVLNLGALPLARSITAKLGRFFPDILLCESEAGLGNGGLGRLASCFLDSLATLQYPARGYGLRYQYGIFEQEIWNKTQVEKPDAWLLREDPWEQRRDVHAASVYFQGRPVSKQNKRGDDVDFLEGAEEVRAIPFETPIIGYKEDSDYSVVSLRLWSTKESPRNFQLQRFNAGFFEQAAENTALTDVLYPNDNHELGKRIRLKQEFLLVSASLQDILRRTVRVFGNLDLLADKVRIQINDTHPALMIAEIVRTLTKNYDFSWNDAWETCQACCSYTNHTILKEALEEWRETRMEKLLPRQYRIVQRLNQQFCDAIRKKYPGDEEKVRRVSILENGQMRMAHLAMVGSHKVNGVAKIHTKILKERLFKDFAEFYPHKFLAITNGVAQRRWLLHANPFLAEFISQRIGRGWITDFSQIEKLASFAQDPESQKEFFAIKKKNKEALRTFLLAHNPLRDGTGRILSPPSSFPLEALFDMQIKRFHEYKRQLMNALHLIMIYHELLENPNSREIFRFSLFSGKAAPGYVTAKQILTLICALGKKFQTTPSVRDKLSVIFAENYNVTRAEIIIPAADLSEQISTAGWEASGTGNMKLAINGALTIGTEDGANIEMHEAVGKQWWPFSFGASAGENRMPYDPQTIYQSDGKIRQAVDSLKEGEFAESKEEKNSFAALHTILVTKDPFCVLKDLRAYYETQKKVEILFQNPPLWAETALRNIAAMGYFSSDRAVGDYARKIWGIEPIALEKETLAKVRKEYFENDRCRIAPPPF